MTSQGHEPPYRRWLAQAYADYQEAEVLLPDPSDDPDGPVGLVPRGLDGALYSPARYLLGTFGAHRPVAFIVTPASTVEIVQAFRSSDERDAWLADRTKVTAERLPGGHLSGVSRTVREERVLAWLLRHGDGRLPEASGLQPEMFRTYSRSEILLAWRAAAAESSAPGAAGPDRGLITAKLAERLRLAPAWAGSYVGWPVGQLAMAYMSRLLATQGEAESAREAEWRLADEDGEARTVTVRSHVSMPAARPQWVCEPKPPAPDDVRQPGRPRTPGQAAGPVPCI